MGRRLSITSLDALDGALPDDAIATLRTEGVALGYVVLQGDIIFGPPGSATRWSSCSALRDAVLDLDQSLSSGAAGILLAAACAIIVSLLLARTIARPVDRVVRPSESLAGGFPPARSRSTVRSSCAH